LIIAHTPAGGHVSSMNPIATWAGHLIREAKFIGSK
jgi:hypothetical protein